jgi:hypothetical protein
MNYQKSLVGSAVAFIVATSCCWLPALLIAIGGGSTIVGLYGLERFSGVFMVVGIGLLAYGAYHYLYKFGSSTITEAILQSKITCPECGHQKEETMPTNACQYFYECDQCQTVLKPTEEDYFVYCSYGTVACPPIQLDQACC